MFKISLRHLLAVAIGAPIFFLLGRFLSIPIFDNTFFTLSYAVLSFFAVVYGPIVGLLIGLIGHLLIDVTLLMIYPSWILTSAAVGFVFGVIVKSDTVERGEFGKDAAIRFIIASLIIHMISWGMIAPILAIIIDSAPVGRAFAPGFIAGAGNFVQTAVIGTGLIFLYSKSRPKPNSPNSSE